jgi:hypothetical protein
MVGVWLGVGVSEGVDVGRVVWDGVAEGVVVAITGVGVLLHAPNIRLIANSTATSEAGVVRRHPRRLPPWVLVVGDIAPLSLPGL